MEELIIKYLEGRITLSEEKTLYDWLEASEESRAGFREVESRWTSSHSPSSEALKIIMNIQSRRKARKRRRLLWGAAAAVVVMFAGSALLFNGNSLKYGEPLYYTVEAPCGTHSRLSLPDGTSVWLNAGSKLAYSTEFGKSDRNIDLDGEAYFEGARNEDLPVNVDAGGCRFTVLGTKFDIQAYGGDENVMAVLMQGSLRCEMNDEVEIMVPGDRVVADKTSGLVKDRVNAEQYRSWIDGLLCYDKIELPVLLKRLSREFDVDIILNTHAFDKRTLHVSFSNDASLETILKAVSETVPITVTVSGKTYTIDIK